MKKLIVALGLGVLMVDTSVLVAQPLQDVSLGILDEEQPEVCRVFYSRGGTLNGVLKDISIAPDGSITMKCSAKVFPPTKKAVIFTHDSNVGKTKKVGYLRLCRTISSIILIDGEPEYTYAETDDWQNVVSASGMSSLVCHYRGGSSE